MEETNRSNQGDSCKIVFLQSISFETVLVGAGATAAGLTAFFCLWFSTVVAASNICSAKKEDWLERVINWKYQTRRNQSIHPSSRKWKLACLLRPTYREIIVVVAILLIDSAKKCCLLVTTKTIVVVGRSDGLDDDTIAFFLLTIGIFGSRQLRYKPKCYTTRVR